MSADTAGIPVEARSLSRREFFSLSHSSLLMAGTEVIGSLLGITFPKDDASKRAVPPARQENASSGEGIRWEKV